VTGDFNGDGRLDLAVLDPFANGSYASPGAVRILTGDGTGGFTLSGSFPVDSDPSEIIADDFNGDGVPALAVTNYNGNTVSILLGDGHGHFRPASGGPITISSQGRAITLAAADFNLDGKPDLVIGSAFGGITVLLGDGTGGFSTGPGGKAFPNNSPVSFAVADYNRDGRPDLIVAYAYATAYTTPNQFLAAANSVALMLGDGDGTFTPSPKGVIATGSSPSRVMNGDFNADGRVDLAILNSSSSSITVVLGDGTGGFNPAPNSPVIAGKNPAFLGIADLNGDGTQDLIVSDNNGTDELLTFLGNGLGGFSAPSSGLFNASYGPFVTGDFNSDGRADLAISDSLLHVVTELIGSPATTFTRLSSNAPAIPIAGQTVTLQVQVSVVGSYFNEPSGSVTFFDGAIKLSTVPSSGGLAIWQTAPLDAGVHMFTAIYDGDPRTAASPPSNQVSVTVQQPSPVQINSVVNSASFQPGIAAPNTILSAFGQFPECDQQVRVLLDNTSAEVLAAFTTQINFVVPEGLPSGVALLQIVCPGGISQPYPIPFAAASPGIFTASGTGAGEASIVNQDGSINGPGNPAAPGAYVSLFVTGMGNLNAADSSGLRRLSQAASVSLGGIPAAVQYAGSAPTFTTGLQQINILVPAQTNGPTAAISLVAGDNANPQTVVLSVKQAQGSSCLDCAN
jgi:uncharacterized protein (TIGR03437 family)